MIKFENTEVVGWEAAIRGMRNPMNSWEKSDSHFGFGNVCCPDCAHTNDDICGQNCLDIGPNDLDLMMRLRSAGTDHRKFMRMIAVYLDITAPLYWWKEFDTYKVGTVANSCSTMHKIAAKEFTLEDFSCEHLLQSSPTQLELYSALACAPVCDGKPQWTPMMHLLSTIAALNHYRQKYHDAEDSDEAKKYWWQMIQLLPSSYNQKRTVMLNYEVLANIYKSRKGHKLDEWRELCRWIEELPYSEIITGGMTDEETDKMFEEVNKILQTEYPKLNNKWPTACELCNANGHGDSDEEHCKKCQFYKYSKWAPDIIANAMAEAYGYPPIDPKKLDPAERTTDTAKAMKDIMDKLNEE